MKSDRLILAAIVGGLVLWLTFSVWDATRPQPIVLQGQIEAREYSMASKVPGRIGEMSVREGDVVAAGQLLFNIDSPEVRARMQQAEGMQSAAAALARAAGDGARTQEIQAARDQWMTAKAAADLAEATYDRMQSLYDDGVVARQRRDEAYAAYEAAHYTADAAYQVLSMATEGLRDEAVDAAEGQAAAAAGVVAEVQAASDSTTVTSSVAGEVATIFLRPGELAPQGFPVVSVVDTEDAWAIFQVREDYLSELPKGATVDVRIPALGEETFPFAVTHISVMGDFATWRSSDAARGYDLRTFEVQARPVQPIPDLRVGMSAVISL